MTLKESKLNKQLHFSTVFTNLNLILAFFDQYEHYLAGIDLTTALFSFIFRYRIIPKFSFLFCMSEKSFNRLMLLLSLAFCWAFVTAFLLFSLQKSYSLLGKESNATFHFISVFGGGLMIGLRAGVWAAFGLSESMKKSLLIFITVLIPALPPIFIADKLTISLLCFFPVLCFTYLAFDNRNVKHLNISTH